MVLRLNQGNAMAVWVWFRPKWESGIKGTERKDGLRAIECTLFRNETTIRSSDLIQDACYMLLRWGHAWDVEWPDGAVTGINTQATRKRRSKHALPGKCYREAGWVPFEHRASDKADVWLKLPWEWFLAEAGEYFSTRPKYL